MRQHQPAHRRRNAGVTLIEMLVVLALFAVVSGAVVMSLPSGRTSTSAEVGAAAFVSDLNYAVKLTLSEGRGFGIAVEDNSIRFLQRSDEGPWHAHLNPDLAQVKLFPAGVRIFDQARRNGVDFVVSARLLPDQEHPLRVRFGDVSTGPIVTFDGMAVAVEDDR